MVNELNLVNLKADPPGVTMTGESRGQHLQVEIAHWPSLGRDTRSRAGDMWANLSVSLMTVPSFIHGQCYNRDSVLYSPSPWAQLIPCLLQPPASSRWKCTPVF